MSVFAWPASSIVGLDVGHLLTNGLGLFSFGFYAFINMAECGGFSHGC